MRLIPCEIKSFTFYLLTFFLFTVNSYSQDSDGDGVTDSTEVTQNRKPNSAADFGFYFGANTTNDGLQGWTKSGTSETIQLSSANKLELTSNGGDPQIRKNNLNFLGSDSPILEVSFKSDRGGYLQLYWKTQAENNFSADKAVLFPDYISAGRFVKQFVDLRENTKWAGQTITGLRLDTINGRDAVTEIQYIKNGINGDSDGDGIANLRELNNGKDPGVFAYNFNLQRQGGLLDGWQRSGTTSSFTKINTGGAKIQSSGNDPFIQQKDVNFQGAEIQTLELEYSATQAGQARLYWQTKDSPSYSASRYISFPSYTTPGRRVKQLINLHSRSEWKNKTITALRLDVINGNGASTNVYSLRNGDTLDTDGDGIFNLTEFSRGFNPNQAFDFLASNDPNRAGNLKIATISGERLEFNASSIPADSRLLALPPFPISQRWETPNRFLSMDTSRGLLVLNVNSTDSSNFNPVLRNDSALISADKAKHFALKFRYTNTIPNSPKIAVRYNDEDSSNAGAKEFSTSGNGGWQIIRTDLSANTTGAKWENNKKLTLDFFQGFNRAQIPQGTKIEIAWMMVTENPNQSLDQEYFARNADYFWKFNYNRIFKSGNLNGKFYINRFQDGEDLAHRRWTVKNNILNKVYCSAFTSKFTSESTLTDPLPKSLSEKGIISGSNRISEEDKEALNIQHAELPIVLNRFLVSDSVSNFSATCDKVSVPVSQNMIRELNDTAVRDAGIVKTAKILCTYVNDEFNSSIERESRKRNPLNTLRHLDAEPSMALSDSFNTVAPNIDDYRGYTHYRAYLNYVVRNWGLPKESNRSYIRRFAAGNEVPVHRAWHYMGNKSPDYVYDHYYRQLRISDIILRSIHKDLRISVESNGVWNELTWPGGVGGGTAEETNLKLPSLISAVRQQGKAEGDFPWGLSVHPYPTDLKRSNWWENQDDPEPSRASLNFESGRLNLSNLEVLFEFMNRKQNLYEGRKREIDIPELGYNSNPQFDPNNEQVQAAAFAYAFRKISLSDQIEAWDYNKLIDNPIAPNLPGIVFSGLRENAHDPENPTYLPSGAVDIWKAGNKKMIYETFAAADRPDWQQVWDSQNLLNVLPISNWDQAAPLTTKLFFTFNDERSDVMWRKNAQNISGLRQEDGTLIGRVNNSNGAIILDAYANTELSDFIYVRMKTDKNSTFALSWETDENAKGSAEIATVGNNTFRTYRIDLKGKPNWNHNIIRRLTVRPTKIANARFEIDAFWSGYAEDSDGDGILDIDESAQDYDQDGLAGAQDFDNDGDGVIDTFEDEAGLSPSEWRLDFTQRNNFLAVNEQNMDNFIVEEGVLKGTTTSIDSQIVMSDLAISSNAYKALVLKMRSDQPDTTVELFWQSDTKPYISNESISIPFTASDEWQTYIFPFKGVIDNDLIRAIRIDPGKIAGFNVEIDEITLLTDIDSDSDGTSDLDEYIAGNRDPKDPSDFGFDFNGPNSNSFEGWRNGGTVAAKIISTSTGTLLVKSSGNDPFIIKDNISIPGEQIPLLELRYKSNKTGIAEIFWKTQTENFFSASKRVSLPSYTTPEEYAQHVVDLRSRADWMNETITGIRIDLINGNGANTRIDSFVEASDLDSDGDGMSNLMEFDENYDPNSASDFGFDFNGETAGSFEGWNDGGTVEDKVISTSTGTLLVRSSGRDPFISRSNLSFKGSQVPALEVRFKSNKTGNLELRWKTVSNNTSYSNTRKITFPRYSTTNQYAEQVISLKDVSNWAGEEITEIRLDLINGADSNTRIDSIVAKPE